MRQVAAVGCVALALMGCGRKPEAPAPAAPTPPAAIGEAFSGKLAAVGTEPFWRADITPGGQIVLTQADQPAGPISAPYAAPAALAGGAAFRSGELSVQFTAGPCSDGMSDTVYPYKTAVTGPGGLTLKGCGFGDWSAALPKLTAAIDACIAVSGGRFPVIWAAQAGEGARVRFDDGEPRECAFSAGKAVFSDTNGAAMPGERDPIFIRAPAKEVGGECSIENSQEVLGADGEPIGWLTNDNEC